ncbi:LuxR C-terminal-related transcriptional regulator [Nocardiopsis listeri]|uniref:helix-turn-helix transcriptional regulator n=1 Tax=Nocardiopsis listeri TaxID=53440 RepID=UPI0026F184A5|nr:LuxR C-terminal-related transcriptional regulator [Nocardiopsis listeri]
MRAEEVLAYGEQLAVLERVLDLWHRVPEAVGGRSLARVRADAALAAVALSWAGQDAVCGRGGGGRPGRGVAVAPAAPVPGAARLTSRETEVLRLLAEGATNARIAESLFISPKTAGVHVSNILAKLDVPNRATAGARARDLGLA